MRPKAPFDALPSGVAIARYFWHETERCNPGCEGMDLWRDGGDYCYLWVTAMVDLDMWHAYLLDVRTNIDTSETRDFLFLFAGVPTRFEVEWANQPIDFGASVEAHRDRFQAGMAWLARRVAKALEDIDDLAAHLGAP